MNVRKQNRVPRKRSSGFSLIEVNMAILIIAIGMLSLMSLFPLGLREGNLAQGDMVQTAAADFILNRVHAEAQTVTDYAEWNGAAMPNRLAAGFARGGIGTLDNFPGDGDRTRYRLRIARSQNLTNQQLATQNDWTVPDGVTPQRRIQSNWRYRVAVQVTERQTGIFRNNPWFYTEVVFLGEP